MRNEAEKMMTVKKNSWDFEDRWSAVWVDSDVSIMFTCAAIVCMVVLSSVYSGTSEEIERDTKSPLRENEESAGVFRK